MRFTTTENTRYRTGIGSVPKSWIDYEKGYLDSINQYFYKHIKLWDWDVCGNETHDFVFEDGKSYRLEYSWWSEWDHDNEEENGLKDEFYIEEISLEQANVPSKVCRDWL